MIHKGKIPAFKVARQWRFLESRLEELVQEVEVYGKHPDSDGPPAV
jgi:helix-turn-helix protein